MPSIVIITDYSKELSKIIWQEEFLGGVTTILRVRLSHYDIEHHHHDEANGKAYGADV